MAAKPGLVYILAYICCIRVNMVRFCVGYDGVDVLVAIVRANATCVDRYYSV